MFNMEVGFDDQAKIVFTGEIVKEEFVCFVGHGACDA